MDDYAHAPVTDNPIVVDFSGCKYLDDLHERIRKSFGFPACCGKNWDAVWDCIDGYFDENESRTIQIRGFSRCQMNYRNTVNQCGVSFPIYRKNAETLLCVMNRKTDDARRDFLWRTEGSTVSVCGNRTAKIYWKAMLNE